MFKSQPISDNNTRVYEVWGWREWYNMSKLLLMIQRRDFGHTKPTHDWVVDHWMLWKGSNIAVYEGRLKGLEGSCTGKVTMDFRFWYKGGRWIWPLHGPSLCLPLHELLPTLTAALNSDVGLRIIQSCHKRILCEQSYRTTPTLLTKGHWCFCFF
jgi:hypothetical protein